MEGWQCCSSAPRQPLCVGWVPEPGNASFQTHSFGSPWRAEDIRGERKDKAWRKSPQSWRSTTPAQHGGPTGPQRPIRPAPRGPDDVLPTALSRPGDPDSTRRGPLCCHSSLPGAPHVSSPQLKTANGTPAFREKPKWRGLTPGAHPTLPAAQVRSGGTWGASPGVLGRGQLPQAAEEKGPGSSIPPASTPT